MMYLMAAVFVGWTIGVVAIVIDWRKDCKEIGRENLAGIFPLFCPSCDPGIADQKKGVR